MMTRLSHIVFLTCILLRSLVFAQVPGVMTYSEYLGIVQANHPLAKQAYTLSDVAKREIQAARGGFDPALKSSYSDKTFDGKEYWKIWESSLIIPVWPGMDLKAGFDQTTGSYLDPEDVTPTAGLTYLGLSVPLGQGLLIDSRRAILLQAKQTQRMAEAERVKQINKVLLLATKDYWDWSFTFQRKKLHEESLRLASVRFEAIRDRVLLGEQAGIDSLEAFIEVQNRQNILSQSVLEEANARLIASNHLWSPDGEAVILGEPVSPMSGLEEDLVLMNFQLGPLLDSARSTHPEILKYDAKIQQLGIEKRWAAEKLRPKLNLDYNFLSNQNNALRFNDYSPWLNNNYKLGLNFSLPLFLREERGKLGIMRLKITQTELEQQQVSREIVNQVRTSFNELNALAGQISVQQQLQLNADKLLEGELYRFSEGESFLFLVNTRENNVINSRIKLAELRTKFAKSTANVYWSAGQMPR
ncbi:MAG: TolC family protein [Bacteroidota bacterium]